MGVGVAWVGGCEVGGWVDWRDVGARGGRAQASERILLGCWAASALAPPPPPDPLPPPIPPTPQGDEDGEEDDEEEEGGDKAADALADEVAAKASVTDESKGDAAA